MPESYIRHIRLLPDADDGQLAQGRWQARLRVTPGHPAVAEMRGRGLKPREEQRYGATYAVIDVPPEHLGRYFRMIDR